MTGERDPSKLSRIFVNEKPFRIHANLFRALEVLRNRESHLWVDAICIDQQNSQERGAQVTLMGVIFSRASKVCAWLGSAVKDSDRAMDFLSYLSSGKAHHEVHQHRNSTLLRWREDRMALANLIRRSWFSRAWIIQEVALAKNVLFMCGYKTSTIAVWEKASQLLLQQDADFGYKIQTCTVV